MFGIGTGELIILFFIVFLVYGPDRLPHLARTLGKIARDLRNATDEVKNAVSNPVEKILAEPKPETKKEKQTPDDGKSAT
ncbi:MAG TPA: twin-arginine translocase TatA/TatE family subunit [Bdellovibrionota bacterium]|nr:twin-arginine translocase TatA/TatE family subunit [Bdellovibrionota bacterium]